MKKESHNYAAWTTGIFSDAVTITNMGKGKFIFLAGVGAEDENGPRGAIRHPGNFVWYPPPIKRCNHATDYFFNTIRWDSARFLDLR